MDDEKRNGEDGAIIAEVDTDLQDIVPIFLDNRREDAHLLQEAVAQGDFETIRVTGHNMKGSGGGYGFDGITEIGKEIETAAKSKDAAAVEAGIEKLTDYLQRVRVVYV